MDRTVPRVRAVTLLHQEGVIGVLALIGLALGAAGPLPSLAPRGGWVSSLGLGAAVGVAAVIVLWILRFLGPLHRLELFQRQMVGHFTRTDALAVALLSGLAEEALLRALLQPRIGLFPAAILFALLHIAPDRRLWLWPVLAFVLGVAFGLLYEHGGYPAAAVAHILMNACALLRMRHQDTPPVGAEDDA